MKILTKKQAQEQALDSYYTGKPCKRGHLAERFTRNGTCKDCHNIQVKSWQSSNRDKVNAAKYKWREENREEYLASRKEYYLKNIDKERERQRKYEKENKDARKLKCKRWREENPEKRREIEARYRKNNKAKRVAWQAARETRKLNACPPWASKMAIEAFYKAAQTLTEQTGIQHHVDHIVPLNHDYVCGLHVPHNLDVITAEENIQKRNNFEM